MILRSEVVEERIVVFGYEAEDDVPYVLRTELIVREGTARVEGLMSKRLLRPREVTELLGYLEGLAAKAGARELEAFADPRHQRVYERHGFHFVGHTEVAGRELAVMRKEV